MSDLRRAIDIIQRYEGYSEKAFPDQTTGNAPYTFGHGTQFYPDGSPVKQGHRCTKRKAVEYLQHEVNVINEELTRLNLGLDDSMTNALVSFIHSIGWEPFLYSPIIDFIEREDWKLAAQEITNWIFDSHYKLIGGLLDRRREESNLFLAEINQPIDLTGKILLQAFTSYCATPRQIKAIEILEQNINPYILAEFANGFQFENCLDSCDLYEEILEYSSVTSWD